jgi:hypothetical protein
MFWVERLRRLRYYPPLATRKLLVTLMSFGPLPALGDSYKVMQSRSVSMIWKDSSLLVTLPGFLQSARPPTFLLGVGSLVSPEYTGLCVQVHDSTKHSHSFWEPVLPGSLVETVDRYSLEFCNRQLVIAAPSWCNQNLHEPEGLKVPAERPRRLSDSLILGTEC